MIAAFALALALASAPPPAGPRTHEPPPARDGNAKDAPPPLSAEDAAVVEHLELLQGMELLEDLPVVDVDDEPEEHEP